MKILIELKTGEIITLELRSHCAIDKMISSLKENIENWKSMTVVIINQ